MTTLMLLRLLAAFLSYCICLHGYSLFPQRWTISSSDSLHCSVSLHSKSANVTLERNCLVERNLAEIEINDTACSDGSYLKLTMLVRFIITDIRLAADSISGEKVFDITLDAMHVFRLSFYMVLFAATDDVINAFETTKWEAKSAYIENNAEYIKNPTLYFREVPSYVVEGLDGFLEVKDFQIQCVPQRDKFIIETEFQSPIDPTIRDFCLLGNTSHAQLLDRTGFDNRRVFLSADDTELHALQPPSVLCVIYTFHKNHDKVKAIRDTWGRKCTGFLAFSDVEDVSIPSIHIPHVGEEVYGNMWQKVRAMWKYVYRHYREEYEYFLFGGDDMYYIMDNLYAYLDSEIVRAERESLHGLYLGRPYYHPGKELFYNTGGPGYLLDSVALSKFDSTYNSCCPLLPASNEDMVVSFCLLKGHDIHPFNTTDEFGRHRWHNFPPDYLFDPNSSDFTPKTVELTYSVDLQYGEECCSKYSIAFHNINKELMYAMDDYLYRCER